MVNKKRVAAIDYGMRRIGIAISDENRSFALPSATLIVSEEYEQAATIVAQYLTRYSLQTIILGHPISMRGKPTPMAERVGAFAACLQPKVDCAIVLFDERLTTSQAEKSLKDRSMNRKKRVKAVDQVASQLLLQSYLDSHQ